MTDPHDDTDDGATLDAVDSMRAEWARAAPGINTSPMAVIGRVSRLSRLVDRRLATGFARHDLEPWEFDVLATLRRAGAPFELTTGTLVDRTMVTTGSMTHRVDKLAARGLVSRRRGEDRRTVLVRLTDQGRKLVDIAAPAHYALEAELLGALTDSERESLARHLRQLLASLGDGPYA